MCDKQRKDAKGKAKNAPPAKKPMSITDALKQSLDVGFNFNLLYSFSKSRRKSISGDKRKAKKGSDSDDDDDNVKPPV